MPEITDSIGVRHELLPCGHCGSEDLMLFEPTYGRVGGPMDPQERAVDPGFIACEGCGCSGPSFASVLAVVEGWNRRVIPNIIREN